MGRRVLTIHSLRIALHGPGVLLTARLQRRGVMLRRLRLAGLGLIDCSHCVFPPPSESQKPFLNFAWDAVMIRFLPLVLAATLSAQTVTLQPVVNGLAAPVAI